MAAYPTNVATFTTKQNVTSVVDAGDPNSIQDEVRAIQIYLGVMPHVSGAGAGTFASVKTRIDAVESGKSPTGHTHIHNTLTGLTGADDHTDPAVGYMRNDGTRHDLVARHTFGGALPTPAAPSTSAVGDAAVAGTAAGPARADHVHGREGWAAVVSPIVAGGAGAAGTGVTEARGDHVHGLSAGVPGGSAPGDTATQGTSSSVARADHVHGREAFSATVAAMSTWGATATAGTAATVARGDHNHGTAQISSVNATVSAPGDAAGVGASTAAARADHVHGREAWATSVVALQTYGLVPAVGTSPRVAHEDHSHGTPDPTLQGPTGVTVPYAGAVAPSGWLLCQGQQVSRATYATLFGVMGTRYGAGDGSTTFTLPDMRNALMLGIPNAGGPANIQGWADHAHGASSGAGSAHAHGASSGAGSAHSHSVTQSTQTGAGSSHAHGASTGTESVWHQHGLAGHVHAQAMFDAAQVGNQNTGVPNNNTSDNQNVLHVHGVTINGEASHTHGIGATSLGNEAGHTHSVTTSNEAAHNHGVTVNGSGPIINVVAMNWIVKT